MVARVAGRIDFKPIPGTELEMEVDLVLLAMGFLGPERNGMLSQLGVKLTDRGNNPYLTGRSDLPAPPLLNAKEVLHSPLNSPLPHAGED